MSYLKNTSANHKTQILLQIVLLIVVKNSVDFGFDKLTQQFIKDESSETCSRTSEAITPSKS